MVDKFSSMKGMQKQIKLNDIQNLRNFNLKLLKRLLQKREVRIIRLKMKDWITRRLYRKYPGVPPLLHETQILNENLLVLTQKSQSI